MNIVNATKIIINATRRIFFPVVIVQSIAHLITLIFLKTLNDKRKLAIFTVKVYCLIQMLHVFHKSRWKFRVRTSGLQLTCEAVNTHLPFPIAAWNENPMKTGDLCWWSWKHWTEMSNPWHISKIHTTPLFFKIYPYSATSMESSRRDFLKYMTEHRPIFKNYQDTHGGHSIAPKTTSANAAKASP